MKKIMIMALMLIGFGISASAQNFGLGVNLGYGSEIEKPSFGIKALYDINESFTLTPSFNYYLKEEVDGFDINFWDINLDLHWNCYDADMYQLYPLAGVTYLKGKVSAEESGFEISSSDGKFGVNLGFGGQLYLTENWLVSAEVKYQIIDNVNQFVPSLSLMYKF